MAKKRKGARLILGKPSDPKPRPFVTFKAGDVMVKDIFPPLKPRKNSLFSRATFTKDPVDAIKLEQQLENIYKESGVKDYKEKVFIGIYDFNKETLNKVSAQQIQQQLEKLPPKKIENMKKKITYGIYRVPLQTLIQRGAIKFQKGKIGAVKKRIGSIEQQTNLIDSITKKFQNQLQSITKDYITSQRSFESAVNGIFRYINQISEIRNVYVSKYNKTKRTNPDLKTTMISEAFESIVKALDEVIISAFATFQSNLEVVNELIQKGYGFFMKHSPKLEQIKMDLRFKLQ